MLIPARPSDVTTIEQEMVRLMMASEEAAPTFTWTEGPNRVNFAFYWEEYKSPSGANLFTGRFTVEMDKSLILPNNKKPWMAAVATPAANAGTIAPYYAQN